MRENLKMIRRTAKLVWAKATKGSADGFQMFNTTLIIATGGLVIGMGLAKSDIPQIVVGAGTLLPGWLMVMTYGASRYMNGRLDERKKNAAALASALRCAHKEGV